MTMKIFHQPAFQRTALAAALITAFGTVHADQSADEIARLTQPASTIEAGIGILNDENRRFGQYNGLRDDGVYGLLNVDVQRRDDAAGSALRLTGRNLGLENREARLEHVRQGDWGYSLDYSKIPRFEPYLVNTGLQGIGTNNLTISTAGKRDVSLETDREAIALGANKYFFGDFEVQLRYRTEDKNGARMYGRLGFDFLAEPLDSTTQQWEAIVNYTGDKLQLSGGYYGTNYVNNVPRLNVAGGSGGIPIMALPPGNESHQLYLSGGYAFTPTTGGTFKLSSSRATQNEVFVDAHSPSAALGTPRTSLDAPVDTTRVQLGLTSRPLPKLSLNANLSWEDRDDKTPRDRYIIPAGNTSVSTDGLNVPHSRTTTLGKLEAGYQLPMGFQLKGGLELDQRQRSYPAVRSVSYRDETRETSAKLELRRALSETLNGAIAYIDSNRTGTDYLLNQRYNMVTQASIATLYSNLNTPIHMADRDRSKVRVTLDWTPLEALSFQLILDDARDTYTTRAVGRDQGTARFYSVDATYAVSDAWLLTAWLSNSDTRASQRNCSRSSGASNDGYSCVTPDANHTQWKVDLRNQNEAYGLGLRGKPMARLDVGADLSHSLDRAEQRERVLAGTAPAGVTFLPDYFYKLTTFKLYGNYAIDKSSGVKVEWINERRSTDDWTWTNFTYNTAALDGTTVNIVPNQKVNFIGITGYHTFR